jgi:hypothetical protein
MGEKTWKDTGVYHASQEYHTAVMKQWLSYAGLNTRQFMRKTFTLGTDEELADKLIEAGFVGAQENVRDAVVQALADYRQIVNGSPVKDNEASDRTLW